MALLKECVPGTIISFPGRKRKFIVRDHLKPFLQLRDGLSSDYSDGKNFTEHSGTHLKDSSGRIRHTRSDKEVIVH